MSGPVIVGATGGSGTRVIAETLISAGCFLGTDLNAANDSRPMQLFLRPWVRRYVESDYGRHLSAAEKRSMASALTEAVARQRQGMSAKHVGWGWKNPPNIVLLEAYLEIIPGSRFVHLVRDGRDMAFSDNRGQLRKFGDLILPDEVRQRPEWEQKLVLWARTNLRAAEAGSRFGPSRYYRLNFETLCDDVDTSLGELLKFAGCPAEALSQVRSAVQSPSSIGRWKQHQDQVEALEISEVADALSLFGYS